MRAPQHLPAPFQWFIAATMITLVASGAPSSAADAAPDVAASLQPFVDRHALAGAVTLVATGERVVSLQAIGLADLSAQTPMRTDNLFWIASMSKPLTGTALMMLVDEGKVDVDAPVTKYLPEFATQTLAKENSGDGQPAKPPVHPITVRNLLTHTSGMPFLSPVEHGKIDLMPLRDAVAGYALLPLKSEPGTRYEYSNCGINTAGRIIEVVSGLAYEDFMEQRLLAPLGMKDTTCWPNAAQLARLAKSYKPNADKSGLVEIPVNFLTYPLDDRKRGPCPAGGYFSTASDLSVFCRMILGGGTYAGKRYLSPASLAMMTSKQTGSLDAQYGFGWATAKDGNGFGHGGAFATDMWIDVPHQLITIYLVQHSGYAGADGGKILPTFKAAALAAVAK